MAITAKLRFLRTAPRKARLVADLIRGKSVQEAEVVLNFTIKKSALPILKLLKSAAANAKNNFQVPEDNLYISKITVDEGPKFKRWMPRARGQAYQVQKKTSHITIELSEIEKHKKKAVKKTEEPKAAEVTKEEKARTEKPKLKPMPVRTNRKQSVAAGIKRMFRRKSV